MRLVLGAIGRLKDGAERTLFDRYWERLEASGRKVGLGPLKTIEIPQSRDANAGARQEAEAQRLRKWADELDPPGQSQSQSQT